MTFPGCGPCKAIAPTFESLAARYSPHSAHFLKVDVDANGAVAQRYSVRAMPTFIFLKNGQVVETLRGANGAKLTQLVETLSKGGAGGNFSGTGHTLSGSGSRSGGASAGAGGIAESFKNIPMENLLPLVIIVAYLAYVMFGQK